MITEKFGKYSVVETLGAGSMGVVYRAEDPVSGTQVAVKVVRSRILYDMERRERFLRNMLSVSLLQDPRICPILELGDDNDDFFVVTPVLDGRTLEAVADGKFLAWPRALAIAIEVLRGLEAVHATGLVHRAVKPSNIWITPSGTVVLTDCALARFTELEPREGPKQHCARAEFADTLIPLSALSYMSPEQVRGDSIDLRSDLFSVGVVLFEMLTGRHPFEARNSLSRMSAILEAEAPDLATRHQQLPLGLDTVVRQALAKNPEDRHQNAASLREQLEAVCRNPVAQPEPRSRRMKILEWCRGSGTFWLVVGIGLAGTAGYALYALM